jgi:hypothetical protein
MTKRILLAGLLGGIAMYVWTALAHMVLPLGEAGIKEIPNEPAVLGAIRSSLGDTSGLYLFPGMGLAPDATSQQKKDAMSRYPQAGGQPIRHPDVQSARPAGLGAAAVHRRVCHGIDRVAAGGIAAGANSPCKLRHPLRIHRHRRPACSHRHQRRLLELVRLPACVHRGLHDHTVRRIHVRRLGGRQPSSQPLLIFESKISIWTMS